MAANDNEVQNWSSGVNAVHTKKMGCFSANFSTPPLMMLVLKVTIPAYTEVSDRRTNTLYVFFHHFDSSAEGQLIHCQCGR